MQVGYRDHQASQYPFSEMKEERKITGQSGRVCYASFVSLLSTIIHRHSTPHHNIQRR
jgi:hypothetical protein